MGRVGAPAENPQNFMNSGANNSDDIPVQFPPRAPVVTESPVKPLVHNVEINGSPLPAPILFTESWNTQLFDCMDDPTNAVMTCCFPCITFGQIAEILDHGQTPCATSGIVYTLLSGLFVIQCFYSSTYRVKLRSRFGLVEAPAPDWITHFLFEPCALSQAYRELQARGIDPTIGWAGNVAQQQAAAMKPPSHQTMTG